MRLRKAGGTLPIGGVPPTLRWLYVMRQLQHEAVSRFFETRLACLCVLLGGPSYAVGADGLTIAGQTYDEPGVSGPGWAAHALLLLAADRARTAASLACTPPMAGLSWMPIGWMRPAPARALPARAARLRLHCLCRRRAGPLVAPA